MSTDGKEQKKFKAVTEEVPTAEEKVKEVKENDKSEEMVLEVSETKNIDANGPSQERRVFLKFFLITFLATLLALIVAGGIYIYVTGMRRDGVGQINNSQTPSPVEVPGKSPSPSPSESMDLSTYKISVLNGSGGIGVATAAKNVIEKAGFKVTGVGNADNFNFSDTMIQVKASVSEDAIVKLKDALASYYSVVMGDALSSQSTFDVVVTVGSKK